MALSGHNAAAALAASLESVLQSRGGANRVFEILELLQADKEDVILCAIRTCSRLFGALLERGELFVGQLLEEETFLTGKTVSDNYSAEDKYKIWMRHRYNSCVNCLVELMSHESFQVKELSLLTLMKFVELEGKYPLVKAEWKGSFIFPREFLKLVVENLIPCEEDSSLLISRFQEYLEYDDVRYFVMKAVTENIGQVMQKTKEVLLPVYQQNVFSLISSISMPSKENEVVHFMVKQANQEEWKVLKLKEHKRAFERMWLGFLKHKLPTSLYKKVLVILHDSILPHLNEPTLMIDFLTVAYDIGGAISLLALNGLFVLIHQHNLEYPDFYKKLYSLLDPSIYHVKYRARFFHLADLFCRHHLSEDPYIMDEEEPSESRALESSLWELQALQSHYHPDVAQAAAVVNQSLSELEDDISELLELSAYELFDREIKKKATSVPLEFEHMKGLFGKKNDLFAEHFALE